MPWPGENSPSPFRLGTTCTWTCGTLWLIRVFTAMKEPSAPSAVRNAIESRRAKAGVPFRREVMELYGR